LGTILYLSTPNLLSGLTINCVSLKIKYIPLSAVWPSSFERRSYLVQANIWV
jgi:hypothetical protein